MVALKQFFHQVLQLLEVGGRTKWVREEDMKGKGRWNGKGKEKHGEEIHLVSGQQPKMMYMCTVETECLVLLS